MKRPVNHSPEEIRTAAGLIDPDFVEEGRELVMLNPRRDDKNRKSFKVNLDTALWSDFATRKKGKGAVALLMFAKGIGRAEATKLLAGTSLGPKAPPPAKVKPRIEPLPAAPRGTPGPNRLLPGMAITGSWPYLNAEGLADFWVNRYDPVSGGGQKEIRPFRWDRQWVMGDPKGFALPLFARDQLATKPQATVLLVEGEKTAVAAQELFPTMVATTSPHGASSAGKADFSPMTGRSIVIWPDNDDPGRAYADDVAKLAYEARAREVRIVEIPQDGSFPEGWDLADKAPKGASLKAILKGAVLVERPKTLADLVFSLEDFMAQPIEPRDYLVFPWLSAASLSLIFAARGLGKSWFIHQLALCLATGAKFFAWTVTRKARVLIVDGEMPSSDLQKRFRILTGGKLPQGLDLLPSEQLWLDGTPLNLNDPGTQERILRMLEDRASRGFKPDLIIFDNLSSLSSGIDENDNGALDSILHWLMALRHQGFAVLLVGHAGKNGDQRGASRREDLLDTSIKLEGPKNLPEPANGACFEISFSKTRDLRPNPSSLVVELTTKDWAGTWKIHQPLSPDAEALQLIQDYAPKSARELGRHLGVTPTTAAKRVTSLKGRGLIQQTKDQISVTPAGIALLQGSTPGPKAVGNRKKYT